jgi:hypothetical protein
MSKESNPTIIMKKLLTLAATVSAFAFLPFAGAVPIQGSIHIDADAGSTIAIDQAANTVTFTPTGTSTQSNAQVSASSGSYAGLNGTAVTYFDFKYDPLTVTGGGPVWQLTLTPTTKFVLTSINNIVEDPVSGNIILGGAGLAFMAGFDAAGTGGSWSFSSSGPTSGSGATAVFSFSSTTAVPDGGTTALLIGAALLGLGVIRRRITA